ncbi:TonB-dependent siderophore receptor [Rhodopseudomonas palustris]|uniref:TonB-dependent siderophore receptor n=1 Tax=Rhodopseudomonas palustris TaxID=1076 RepID=A0A323UKT5_RHOPL|nr:TonB-dependent receptor [Rhodopseudomonas palustris]PZA13235.1 TonB-dependent siderophore receptor [Rhodopseudomonas palustris]
MSNFKNNKNRLYLGVAAGVVTATVASLSASPVRAQDAERRVLPPVSVDAPQQRARPATRTAQPRATPQRAARVAPRRAAEPPPPPAAPPTTMGSTRTIGAPAPAYAGGQVAQGGTLGLLGSTSVMNTPFSTVNFTSQLIQDQQARTAADTLINDSSVRLSTGPNGFDDTFQIRGFQVNATDVGLNGLYGLVSSSRVPAQIIERIELLKGPGALINGIAPGGSIGGAVNIVTKRATEVPFARVTPFFMSAGNYGVQLDSSQRFGANKEWGVRFNGVARNGEASVDGGNWRSGVAALSVDYRGDRLRWTLDAITQNDDTKNFRPQMSIQTGVPFIPAPPDARGNWYPGTVLNQRDHTIASGLEYDITDWLTAYAGLGYRQGENYQTFPDSRVSGYTGGIDQFGNFRLINAYYDSYSQTVSGNAGVRAKFNTGFIGHSVNVAYTGFNQEAGNAYVANSAAQSVPSNIYNPSPLPFVTGARNAPQKSSDTTLTSVAIADTMSFLNDTVLLTLGARQQNVKVDSFNTTTGALTSGYDASATTPLAGIVIKPWHNVSLYANYAEGLSRGTIVGAGYANTGAVLAPYKSKQQEAGIKVDWGTITTTAAVFQITRPNSIRNAANELAYDGEQRNRGVELSVYGLILPGLRGMASATFLKPELTNPTNPLERGNDAAGVPDTTVSAGLDWDTPWVRGLALNGRVIYTSGSYLTSANLPTQRFPDWTRLDLGARYTTTAITGKPVTFRASIENVTGENYWLTTGTFVTVGAPRTYLLSAAFDF